MLGRLITRKPFSAQVLRCLVSVLVAALAGAAVCHALSKGDKAEVFSLQDIDGATYELAQIKAPLTVLYFFDAQSRPSQEGILLMDRLVKKFKGRGLAVLGVTRSPHETTADYVAKAKPCFPILLDTSDVSDRFGAKAILPAACAIGPDMEVLDFIRGGGKSMNARLVKLAETRLKQGSPAVAEDTEKTRPEKSAARSSAPKTGEIKQPASKPSPRKSPAGTQAAQAPANSPDPKAQSGEIPGAAPADAQADTSKKPIRWDKTFELKRQNTVTGGQGAVPYGTAPQTAEPAPRSTDTAPTNEEGIFGRGRSVR